MEERIPQTSSARTASVKSRNASAIRFQRELVPTGFTQNHLAGGMPRNGGWRKDLSPHLVVMLERPWT